MVFLLTAVRKWKPSPEPPSMLIGRHLLRKAVIHAHVNLDVFPNVPIIVISSQLVAFVVAVAPYFEVLHVDIFHNVFLAFINREVGNWIGSWGTPTAPALGASAKGDEVFRCCIFELLC